MGTQEYLYIYKNDPFEQQVWLHDTDPELTLADDDPARGFNLSGGTVTARVGNKTTGFTSELVVVPFADQVANKGWVFVRADNTTAWPLGKMLLQLRLTIAGKQKTAHLFEFNVLEGV